jgi:ribosomal protein S18 acetylase RimI-like enzyme
MRRDEVLALEDMNFNAWPALKTVHYDGWLIRCSGGGSRRPNSVNCVHASTITLGEKIEVAEAFYARWQQRPIFRLTPLADDGLDRLLEQRGYTVEEPTFVQQAPIHLMAAAPNVQVFPAASEAWIEAATHVRGLAGRDAEIFAMQHRAVAVDSGWALVAANGHAVAAGTVAIERAWAGLHGIHVAKGVRRRGLARQLTEGLLGFAYARGARRAWLQVAQANVAALPLYHSLGFRTAYSYHHRVGLR